MHRIYKKEYDVLLRSFISRTFFGTIVASSLFACGGVSKEELEAAVESEAKAAKEETEKVKKELSDKITALEGRAPAVIAAADYTNIKGAVGLNATGNLDANVNGSLAKDVAELKVFQTVTRVSVGLDGVGDLDYAAAGSLAKDVAVLKALITKIQASVGLDGVGDLDYAAAGSLAKDIAGLKTFRTAIQASVGLNAAGGLDNSKGLAKDVAAIPAKIVKGVNALGRTFTLGNPPKNPQIQLGDL